jgi:hypothetical protein
MAIDESPIQPVYHYLKFKNPVKQNLISAPVFVENFETGSDIALGQPWMEMTPVAGNAKFAISQNSDLPVRYIDEEQKRTQNAYSINNRNETLNFDLVQMKGTIRIENQSVKEKTVRISRYIEGKPVASEQLWKLTTRKPQAGNPNSSNETTWEIVLKPGEQKTFTYTYEYYLRIY